MTGNSSPEFATLEFEGKSIKLPVVIGTEGEKRWILLSSAGKPDW